MRKKQLIIGNKYNLCVTGSFCHAINSEGYLDSLEVNNDMLQNLTYVGIINIEKVGYRQIFYNTSSDKNISYVMFSNENLNHIID
ncbi:MAG: hypothetical protein PQJ49_01865 [Sphaerochaetaceae bacterium]|nr:hypothetical protein [Sphaerochaetaceae bacterium]